MNFRDMLIKHEIQQELVGNVLPFWRERMVDRAGDGFHGQISADNQLIPGAPRSIILNSRILWAFSAAYDHFSLDVDLDLAKRAYSYIRKYFVDEDHGGVYWMVSARGEVLDDRKQIYAQAFVIYALTEFYKITRESGALKLALDLFILVESHALDQREGGYIEAFQVDWSPIEDFRLSEKDMNAAKTMNTHLHVLEAYTNLYQVNPTSRIESALEELIALMSDQFLYDGGHFKLFFDKDWSLLSEYVSYGHDIEGSWLLCKGAETLGDQKLLEKTKVVALKMLEASLKGMDSDGGLMNEGTLTTVLDRSKDWWPQAEALVGLINGYEITSNEKYLQYAAKTWHFIQDKIVDPAGEWYWGLDAQGNLNRTEDKAGPWKCPYHNGRALLELLIRLD